MDGWPEYKRNKRDKSDFTFLNIVVPAWKWKPEEVRLNSTGTDDAADTSENREDQLLGIDGYVRGVPVSIKCIDFAAWDCPGNVITLRWEFLGGRHGGDVKKHRPLMEAGAHRPKTLIWSAHRSGSLVRSVLIQMDDVVRFVDGLGPVSGEGFSHKKDGTPKPVWLDRCGDTVLLYLRLDMFEVAGYPVAHWASRR